MLVPGPKFKFIAGALCLDFINTAGGRVAAGRIAEDKLAGFVDLLQWGELAGVLSRAEARKLARGAVVNVRGARAVFHRAIALREALYRVSKCCIESRVPPKEDVAVLNREWAGAQRHRRLIFSRQRFVVGWDEPVAPDRIAWSVIGSAVEVLASPKHVYLRQCPGDGCGWMFLDTSRNGARQWCEMRICGNRAKVRRFRARRPETD